MELFLRFALPLYMIAYAYVCFFWRIHVFKKQTGINPVIIGDTESPHGYVGFLLKLLSASAGLSVALFAACPETYGKIWNFSALLSEQGEGVIGIPVLVWMGMVLSGISLVLTTVAQMQMGKSWRVGIETTVKTEIVKKGIYQYSRNPIYLGIMMSNIALFMVLPNVLNLFILIFGFTTLQVLIRLEEAHMRALHPLHFDHYCKSVRRWI